MSGTPTTTANRSQTAAPGRSAWVRRVGVVTAAAALTAAALAPAAHAATTYTATKLTAEVKGNSVTAGVTVGASTAVTAQRLKICVRTHNGGTADFPGGRTAVKLKPSVSHTETRTFPVGTYSYFGCVKVADSWIFVGTKKSFTVTATTGISTDTADPKMPTSSSKSGWAYSYGQDFTTAAPLGSFSRTYGKSWAGYVGVRNDTSRNGSYQPDKVLSVADGKLDMALGYDKATGQYNVAAPFPTPPAGVNGGSIDYLGMRTSIRFKSSGPIKGYKTAWLLWPGSWKWDDGEIDFPEGPLDAGIGGYVHQANTGNPHLNTLWMHSPNTYYDGWHTATTEWIPGKSVEFFLDGISVGKTTSHIPTKPMHWTLQTETNLNAATPPSKDVKGHVQIDWLTVESYRD